MKYRSESRSSEEITVIHPPEPAGTPDPVLRKLLSLTFSLAACAELLEQREAERIVAVIAEIDAIIARLRADNAEAFAEVDLRESRTPDAWTPKAEAEAEAEATIRAG